MTTTITVHVGEDDSFELPVSDANGQPIADLTDYDFAAMVRASVTAATPLLSLTSDDGTIERGAGKVTLHFGHDATAGIIVASGVLDIRITDPLDAVRYTPRYTVTFLPAVTR